MSRKFLIQIYSRPRSYKKLYFLKENMLPTQEDGISPIEATVAVSNSSTGTFLQRANGPSLAESEEVKGMAHLFVVGGGIRYFLPMG